MIYPKTACIETKKFGSTINRESYISVHVLLNVLNELSKRDKMRGLPSILSLFVCRAFYLFFAASNEYYLYFATSLIDSIIQERQC